MREKMLALFRATVGGRQSPLRVRVKYSKIVFRCKPAINEAGDLYVSLYEGKKTRPYHSMSLDEWAGWAEVHAELI